MEDEINLREYLQVLIKHRWLIVAGTVVAALAAFVVSFLFANPTYEATAGVLIAQTRSRITFDPRFQTVESGGLGTNYYAAMNQQAHRWALVSLVKSGTIATQVAEQLKGKLDPEKQNPAKLLEMVSGRLWETGAGKSGQNQGASDIIQIKVKSSEPAEAAQIANAWAKAYEIYINELYSKGPESYTSVQRQTVIAQATYEQAEKELTDFAGESQIDDLQRRITDTQQRIDDLRKSKQAVFAESAQMERVTLSQYYAISRKLRRLLEDAKSLRLQIQQSGDSAAATNELALMLLKAEAFASSGTLPGNLQLQFDLSGSPNPGANAQVADLEALIEVVEKRLAELDTAIAEQSLVLLSGESFDSSESASASEGQPETAAHVAAARSFDAANAALQEELSQLQVQLAQEQATKKELTRARDLAWDTYTTLQTKSAELGIATEMKDVEVRFASPAVEPIEPIGSNKLQNVVLAAVVGLMMSVGIAFVFHYLDPEYDSSAAVGALVKRPKGTD